jgi:DNA-binding CsgD family transcriptional regulator
MPPPKIPGLEGACLTPRESDVVHLILAQLSNVAISLHLDCSVKNVEAHVTNILRKTQTSTRLDLVMKIMRASQARGGDGGTTPMSER